MQKIRIFEKKYYKVFETKTLGSKMACNGANDLGMKTHSTGIESESEPVFRKFVVITPKDTGMNDY